MGFISFFKNLFGLGSKPIESKNKSGDRILLIGINKYEDAPLRGCLNDIKKVDAKFRTLFPFYSNAEIRTLLDAQATTAAIIENLKWLAETPAGFRAYLHFSGHGAQVPTGDNSEPDGLSEVICPTDFDWKPAHMITDKQFVSIFSKMDPSVKFGWANDSCHSGDVDRAFMPGQRSFRSKCLKPPSYIADRTVIAKARKIRETKVLDPVLNVGFLSGCRSGQTSADTMIDDQYCGAFTHFYLKNLSENPDMPLNQLVAKISVDLKNDGYEQRPCAEGKRAHLPMFG